MSQEQIKAQSGTVDSNGALVTYSVPGSVIITPYAVSVTADGTGASGAFLPCLTFKTQAGAVIARCPAPEVAQGASAEVSWFPHVGGEPFVPVPGTGIPPAGNLDGYIFKKSNVTVTGTGHSNRSTILIQGNPVTLDGKTSILIEYFCSWVEINTGVTNQAAEVEVWDNFSSSNVDKGTIGVFEYFGADTAGAAMYASLPLTPAAGTHTYSLYGWKNVAASTVTFVANTLLDGSGNVAPMWYRIVVIPYDNTLPS